MTRYPEASQINEMVENASKIVVIQADNPDGDSLASALALEQILGDMAKEVILYCGVDIPSYLLYMPGADRVTNDLPKQFDLSVIVDNSSDILLQQLDKSGAKAWLASKPSIIIDHHATAPTITFASVICSHPAVASAEVIYELAGQNDWSLNRNAKELIAIGIFSDSLGLTSEGTTARSVHVIGELVEAGVNLAKLENARRETMRKEPELIHYKGKLLSRVEFHDSGRIVLVSIPQEEIEEFSPLYNPPMLVLDDMRLAKKADLAVAFKVYKDGKITAKIRSNYGRGISDKLAEAFGGGGHPYAAGFKLQDGRDYQTVKNEFIKTASEMLDKLESANENP